MSISSEISRISGNVSAALTAIGNKGVTIPQGSTSDDLATLIGSIQTGGGSTLVQKNITLNGTYDPDDDNADGYSAVTVNVQGGASMSEVANAYGTELVITSAPGSAPSATRHTLYFEYEDESTETVYAYYDDALIGTAITATTPTTHSSKTVTLAQLDGVTWYSYTPSTGTYETVLDDTVQVLAGDPYGNFWISDLGSVTITAGSEWKITLDGTTYLLTASQVDSTAYIGNPKYAGKTDDGSSTPFCFYNAGWGAWNGGCDTSISGTSDSWHALKVERKTS